MPLLDYVGNYIVLWGDNHNLILRHEEFVGSYLWHFFVCQRRKVLQFDLVWHFVADFDLCGITRRLFSAHVTQYNFLDNVTLLSGEVN